MTDVYELIRQFGELNVVDGKFPHQQFVERMVLIDRPECRRSQQSFMSAYADGCRCLTCRLAKMEWNRLYKWGKSNGWTVKQKRDSTAALGRPRRFPIENVECQLCGITWNATNRRKYPICQSCENKHPSIVRRFRRAQIDPQKLVKLLLDQRCEICLKNMDGQSGQQWNLDHDHKISPVVTAESFRGVICSRCNTLVGYIEATPELVEPAKQYIIRNAEKLRHER